MKFVIKQIPVKTEFRVAFSNAYVDSTGCEDHRFHS